MRTTDPFRFFHDHREVIFRWGGILAAALAVYLLLRFVAMRLGGWRAAGLRLWREIALTAHSFAAPLLAWWRYRRSLRTLIRGLSAGATWRDAERALAAARLAAAPARPYAAVVTGDAVTVFLAGVAVPSPHGIWSQAAERPWEWIAARAEIPAVVTDAEGVRPVIVAVGAAERGCVFLDVAVGPSLLCVEGEPLVRSGLFQAVAAQLDVRLPAGRVVVAEGVHPEFAGEPVRAAYRTASATPPRSGVPTFLATVALPDPLPPELAEPPSGVPALRVLLEGPGRGYVRTLLTDRTGRVAVVGTPVLAACHALGVALARVLSDIPPVLPPAPFEDPEAVVVAAPAQTASGAAASEVAEEAESTIGVSAARSDADHEQSASTDAAAEKTAAEPEPEPEPPAVSSIGAAASTGSPGRDGRP